MCQITILVILLGSAHAQSEQVGIEFKGIGLTGNLASASGTSLKEKSVVLILHDVFDHHGSSAISSMQSRLLNQGINSLAITLSYGLDQRQKPYSCDLEQDPRFSDAADEVKAWSNWLGNLGVKKIVLAGFGWGADQLVLYTLGTPGQLPELVTKLILIAPGSADPVNGAVMYEQRFGQKLSSVMQKAGHLIAEGRGADLVDVNEVGFLSCKTARVTAAAFNDYYGTVSNRFTDEYLVAGTIPVLYFGGRATQSAYTVDNAPTNSNPNVIYSRNFVTKPSQGLDEQTINEIIDFLNR